MLSLQPFFWGGAQFALAQSFRAITRAETLATQASGPAKKRNQIFATI